jgi:dTDP-4-amino-4,6-dideoxygalactose transaminase
LYFNLDSIDDFGDLLSVDDIYVGFSSSYSSVLNRATSFIKSRTSKSEAVFLPSGRSAVYIICKYLVEKNKSANIILPGYTCSVVASAALSAGIEVRYCDVEADSFKLDKTHLATLCDNNTDAVLIQHIFGFTENVDEIKSIASGSIIVEDCAHSFGLTYIGEKFWTGTREMSASSLLIIPRLLPALAVGVCLRIIWSWLTWPV